MPAVLGLVGAIGPGLAVAPALRVLTYPFLGLTLLFLGRGWYLQTRPHRMTTWRMRALVVLIGSTVLSASLWGLRFAGLLGPQPF